MVRHQDGLRAGLQGAADGVVKRFRPGQAVGRSGDAAKLRPLFARQSQLPSARKAERRRVGLMRVQDDLHVREAGIGRGMRPALAGGLVRPFPFAGLQIAAGNILRRELFIVHTARCDQVPVLVQPATDVAPRPCGEAFFQQDPPGRDDKLLQYALFHAIPSYCRFSSAKFFWLDAYSRLNTA